MLMADASSSSAIPTEEHQNYFSYQHGELLSIDQFLGIRRRKQDTEIKVK